MIFRSPRGAYSITLKRAHELLKIPQQELKSSKQVVLEKQKIQNAFREAARQNHPDTKKGSKKIFQECHDARELLLDYYVRRKFVPREVIESKADVPCNKPYEWKDDTFFSVWKTNRSFQMEAFWRLSVCLGLAVGTFYHDKTLPERRARQIRNRDAQFSNFGPQTRF